MWCVKDTVIYARESIRLLAKSLAMYSDHPIIQQLYAYAPDNLAWLWAFFDWETPIDLARVPSQDTYRPFGWFNPPPFEFNAASNAAAAAAVSGLTDEHLNAITRIYAEAPLIQYKYRRKSLSLSLYHTLYHWFIIGIFVSAFKEELMIGDLYKFLEHVQNNVSSRAISISLFMLYFPSKSLTLNYFCSN